MKKLLYILLFVPVALFGQDNYSLSFDGVDDYVSIGQMNLDNDFSFDTWVYVNSDANLSYSDAGAHIFNFGASNLTWASFAFGVSNNSDITTFPTIIVETGQNNQAISNHLFPLDEWVHITVIFNYGVIDIYQNGVNVLNYDTGLNEVSSNYDFAYIGSRGPYWDDIPSYGTGWYFNGGVNYIRCFDYILSDEEIQSYIDCSPSGNEDGLIAYWNFNEGSGDTVYDLSGNGNHGIIHGATHSYDVPEQNCSSSDLPSIIDQLNQSFDAWNISIDLSAGWNMFGYGCPSSIDVAEGLSNHTESIIITKDNNGNVYMPEFGFNGIGDLTPGFGYQIKLTEAIEGFSLCDWYVNDIPEDNIVSLQEEVEALQAELDGFYYGCTDSLACNYNSYHIYNDGSCIYPEQGFDCDGLITIQVGDEFQGGILFYIDDSGQHGLVASIEDLPVLYEWGCSGEYVGVQGTSIGSGYQNTMDIVNQGCTTNDGGITAALAALDSEINGYSDWYLPSIDELMEMDNSIGDDAPVGNIGDFETDSYPYYWSSSESNYNKAWNGYFHVSSWGDNNKHNLYRVRVIRSF